MHTFWQRTNALATYAGTVLAVMCIAVTITDCFHESNPIVKMSYKGVEGLENKGRYDRAHVVMDMYADLRNEFTWNTKQLYVYATFEFETKRNPVNKMVMWDAIIQKQENALLEMPQLRTTYPHQITDQQAVLRGRDFNVSLAWNVMPRVGRMYTRSRTFSGFTLPKEYIKLQKGNVRTSREAAKAA